MKISSKIFASAASAALALTVAVPAFAQVGLGVNASVNANTSVGSGTGSVGAGMNANASGRMSSEERQEHRQENVTQHMNTMTDRGDDAIQARITSLTNLQTRINDMKNLSDSQKASFSATIQTQISAMNTLLAKIKSDTSTTTLREDLKTIAPAYRIFALVHPQLTILAAADRVGTIVTSLQTLATKFDARIAAHANADASAKLADLRAKIADASTQASAAASLVVNLKPDNGDASVAASNKTALENARAKIKLATQDLHDAYKDAQAISKDLRVNGSVNATSTSSVESH